MTGLEKRGAAPAAAGTAATAVATSTPGRAAAQAALAMCTTSLKLATRELWAAEASRDRPRSNRARIAVDRLRQRYKWLAARSGQTDGVPVPDSGPPRDEWART